MLAEKTALNSQDIRCSSGLRHPGFSTHVQMAPCVYYRQSCWSPQQGTSNITTEDRYLVVVWPDTPEKWPKPNFYISLKLPDTKLLSFSQLQNPISGLDTHHFIILSELWLGSNGSTITSQAPIDLGTSLPIFLLERLCRQRNCSFV